MPAASGTYKLLFAPGGQAPRLGLMAERTGLPMAELIRRMIASCSAEPMFDVVFPDHSGRMSCPRTAEDVPPCLPPGS